MDPDGVHEFAYPGADFNALRTAEGVHAQCVIVNERSGDNALIGSRRRSQYRAPLREPMLLSLCKPSISAAAGH
jgi:hypothetical protein